MKRYTITNHSMQKTWVMECEDLYAFYQNGLPDEYVGAEISEIDVTEELAQEVAAQKIKVSNRDAKIQSIAALKGKSFSSSDIKMFCETMHALMFDPDIGPGLITEILKLTTTPKNN